MRNNEWNHWNEYREQFEHAILAIAGNIEKRNEGIINTLSTTVQDESIDCDALCSGVQARLMTNKKFGVPSFATEKVTAAAREIAEYMKKEEVGQPVNEESIQKSLERLMEAHGQDGWDEASNLVGGNTPQAILQIFKRAAGPEGDMDRRNQCVNEIAQEMMDALTFQRQRAQAQDFGR